MSDDIERARSWLRSHWTALREYLGAGGRGRVPAVDSPQSLRRFVQTRASHVAQTSLYGYLKARSGTRYPELFEHPTFLVSINIAKWQVWLACLSDLCVYAGGLMTLRAPGAEARVGALIGAIVEQILEETGVPPDAGDDFVVSSNRLRERLRICDWSSSAADDTVFTESPRALAHWAPVADSLKRFDIEIVENSVSFRWVEVRGELRRILDAPAVLADEP